MQVEVRNNGNLHTIGFARGKTVQPLEVIPGGANGLTGTHFKTA
jgi:DNA gyrase/topoisomerase IV subunit B